ncbi:triose-phosphate isomerase, partial [Pseudomonas brassicacearum]
HTGDISAEMIADCFGTHVIVGHSERRTDHAETDHLVRAKASAAHQADLIAIVCIGETADERKAGQTLDILKRQLAGSLPDEAT